MLVIVVLCASVMFQALAAVAAFRLIKTTHRNYSWALISAALLLMTVRRLVPLYFLATTSGHEVDLTHEAIGLILSVFMFVGVTRIRPMFEDRRTLEEKERESAAKLQTVINEAPVCIATVGLDKRFLTCNAAFCAFLGYSEKELQQKTISEVTLPEDAAIGMADLGAIVAGKKQSSRVEKRYVRKDGTVVWGEVSINLVRNGQGQPLYFMPFILDMTGRKRAEEEQQKSGTLTQRITENSPFGMHFYELDDHDQLIFAGYNPAADKLIGLDNSQFIGKTIGEAFPPLLQTEVPERYRDAASTGTPWFTEQVAYDDGRIVGAFEVTAFQTSPGSMVAVFANVTERKRAEEAIRSFNAELEQRVRDRTVELEASTKELEAFSYSVSHDLRAPLRSVDGFSLALLEDCEDKLDADGKDYLRRIRAATQRMGTLIDDMLRLSRLTRTEMLFEKVDLTEIAWSIINELQKSYPERAVKIDIAKGLEVTADRKLIRIALENLLGNAWKFTGKRPEATIELGSTNDGAKQTYFVRDNGAGFDMAYVNKLFTPFQRLHSIEEYPGTGIGLGTVQRIIHRHGGKVWAEGQVGKGATFYFNFTNESRGVRS